MCRLVSLNLVTVAEPTFHIARFLPSIRDSRAPLLFVWHVSGPFPCHDCWSIRLSWPAFFPSVFFSPRASMLCKRTCARQPGAASLLQVGPPVTSCQEGEGSLQPCCCGPAQVLVPGKQNYSLALAWALDYDPTQRVHRTVAEAAARHQQGAPGSSSCAGHHESTTPASGSPAAAARAAPGDSGGRLSRQASLHMRRASSAAELEHVRCARFAPIPTHATPPRPHC